MTESLQSDYQVAAGYFCNETLMDGIMADQASAWNTTLMGFSNLLHPFLVHLDTGPDQRGLFVVALKHDKLFAYAGLMVLSFYINAMCMMAELIVMTHAGLSSRFSELMDLACHIFIGPISAIAFIARDSFSTMIFFACLWHFFNDVNAFRPSYMVCWRSLFDSSHGPRVHTMFWIHWILALTYFIHHFWIATAKLALNEYVLQLPSDQPLAGCAILAWLIGSGMVHLSVAMGEADMKSYFPVRVFSITIRVGADFIMYFMYRDASSDFFDWALLGFFDICWWIVQSILLIWKAHLTGKMTEEELDALAFNLKEGAKQASNAIHMEDGFKSKKEIHLRSQRYSRKLATMDSQRLNGISEKA